MSRPRILIVEDEAKTSETLRAYLQADGFEVEQVRDGRAGLVAARAIPPQLVILDLMLPGCDGLTVARQLRTAGDVPILMLTARTSESDRLVGLQAGADDYVSKPFSPREVVMRVRAILRRTAPAMPPGSEPRRVLGAGELTIDLDAHVARWLHRDLALTPAELSLLAALARRPGRVFTRDELARAAFGEDWDALGRTIDAHVSRLRRKLVAVGDREGLIVTVFGVGYRLMVRSDAG